MNRRRKWCLPLTVLVAACACMVARPEYTEPPADTYTAGARQLKTDGGVTPIEAAAVTPGFFRAAGVQPLLGRFLVEADDGSATSSVAVISHDLWVQRFRSSPDIIGKPVELDGKRYIVVGVAPRGFTFPGATLLWTSKGVAAR